MYAVPRPDAGSTGELYPYANNQSDELAGIWRAGGLIVAALAIWAALFSPTKQTAHTVAGLGGSPLEAPRVSFVTSPTQGQASEWAHGGPEVLPLEAEVAAVAATNSPDDLNWEKGFTFPYRGVSGSVHALVEATDGSVFVGGAFEFAGNVRAGNIARLDPVTGQWTSLRGGVNSVVSALAMGPDGRLYVGGAFSQADGSPAVGLAVWDPILGQWSTPTDSPNQAVEALQVLPDGRVAVGGGFTAIGPVASEGIAFYDPTADQWSSAFGGVGGRVTAIHHTQAGDLVVGGVLPAYNHVAALRAGTTHWAAMGDGAPGPVQTIESTQHGILLGGRFSSGPVAEEFLLTWMDATASWAVTAPGLNGSVDDLLPLPTGELLAVGSFTKTGQQSARGVAVFDGAKWLPTTQVNSRVRTTIQLASGTVLAGGAFTELDGENADGLAMWTSPETGWTPIPPTLSGSGLDGPVFDVAFQAGEVLAAGVFTRAGTNSVASVAAFHPSERRWRPLGDGLDNLVKTLAPDKKGGVYAGGYFTASGSMALRYVAYWDGASWHPLGHGLNGAVEDIALGTDGRVYVAGYFSMAGSVPAAGVAIWDPVAQQWSGLGQGMNAGVDAIAVSADDVVYAGGSFTLADGRAAAGIAQWDPVLQRWDPLGFGKNSIVRALVLSETGQLYAGGIFTRAGTIAADYVARWDPQQETWHPLGLGLDSAVRSLAAAPDGSILVGGVFRSAGGHAAPHIVRWLPAQARWEPLGSGVNASVRGMAHDEKGNLYVGGFFTQTGPVNAAHFGMWTSGTATASQEEAAPEVPQGVRLHQNYPNPFNPNTSIGFELPRGGRARLTVFDLLGREVSVLARGHFEAGSHQIAFDASQLPTGSYVYRLDTEDGSQAKTLTLVR